MARKAVAAIGRRPKKLMSVGSPFCPSVRHIIVPMMKSIVPMINFVFMSMDFLDVRNEFIEL